MKTSLFLGTALTAMLVTGMASAAKHSYTADEMDVEKEIPKPTKSSANSGDARFTYDDVTHQLCGHITFNHALAITAAHIHGPAKDTEKADPLITFDVPADAETTIHINKTITEAQGTALTGDNYVNVHTTDFPEGELRAQLIADLDETAADEPCEEVDAGTSSSGGTGTDSGTGTTSGGTSGSTTKSDAGTSGSTATPADTTDSGGCSTTGSSSGSTMAILAGLGLVVAAASRKRKKA